MHQSRFHLSPLWSLKHDFLRLFNTELYRCVSNTRYFNCTLADEDVILVTRLWVGFCRLIDLGYWKKITLGLFANTLLSRRTFLSSGTLFGCEFLGTFSDRLFLFFTDVLTLQLAVLTTPPRNSSSHSAPFCVTFKLKFLLNSTSCSWSNTPSAFLLLLLLYLGFFMSYDLLCISFLPLSK